MNITAEAVKQLRERTGAGMMECKKALVETKGDLDAAAELMRKQGIAKADKKADPRRRRRRHRHRARGRRPRRCHGRGELRDRFRRPRAGLSSLRAGSRAPRRCRCVRRALEALLEARLASGESIDERRRALVAKIGENISVRRFAILTATGHLGAYVHGTRIGALVALEGGDATLAHDLAMHVAASNPRTSRSRMFRPRSLPRSARF